MTDYFIFVPVGYVLGALPFGLLVGKVFKRIDVRQYGSGKTGMTNVLRTVGLPAAILVLVLDMGKGVLAVMLAKLFSGQTGVEAAAGLAALFGHNWPVFIGFRGGRGVATGWASLFAFSPIAGLVATVIGLPAVAITRYVSLGSILGASSGALALIALALLAHEPLVYVWYGAVGGVLVVVRHRDNIERLIKGEERKLGQRDEEFKPSSDAGTRAARAQE